jgi:hypothetical protein
LNFELSLGLEDNEISTAKVKAKKKSVESEHDLGRLIAINTAAVAWSGSIAVTFEWRTLLTHEKTRTIEGKSILGGKDCIISAESPTVEKVRRARVHRRDSFPPSSGSS